MVKGALVRMETYLLVKRYVGKPLEVRVLRGTGRTSQKAEAVFEAVREEKVHELRTVTGVTYMRSGRNYLFFLNASRPVAPEADQPSVDLGAFAGRATRVMKDTRSFNVQEIETDPKTGAFYYLEKA